MRLPYFKERCPHVRDQIVEINGGRLNIDHAYRVLRARAVLEHMVLPRRKPAPTKEAA